MKLVNLVIGGVQKGGTTTLFEHLRCHKEIVFGDVKELHVADERESFSDADYDLAAAYARRFPFENGLSAARYLADATPIYCYWPNSIEWLAKYNPSIKLILIYRDPIERAFSHWQMEYARGDDSLSFPQAIRSGRARVASDPSAPGFHRVFSYVERGFYSGQLRRVLKHFPREQVLLLENRMLRNNLAATFEKIWSFLEVEPPAEPMKPILANTAPKIDYRYTFDRRDGEFLYRLFESDITAFAELSGLDVSHWGRQYRSSPLILSTDVLREQILPSPDSSFPANAYRQESTYSQFSLHEGRTEFVDDSSAAIEKTQVARLRLEVLYLNEKLRLQKEAFQIYQHNFEADDDGSATDENVAKGFLRRFRLRRP